MLPNLINSKGTHCMAWLLGHLELTIWTITLNYDSRFGHWKCMAKCIKVIKFLSSGHRLRAV
ncbi:hypothetical protein HanPI659440_Chr12g0465641 [Helianthus annuus]|nr:hypothetical protein HanPI659440_Chr12g0465641 [Helianthus annuus]